MAEVIESPAPEVVAPVSPPVEQSPRRFEIPSFIDKKAEDAPTDAPKADSPPAAEVKPPVVVDPEAERVAKARAERQRTNRLFKQLAEEKVRREQAERERDALRKPEVVVAAGGPDPSQFTDIKEYEKAVRLHERNVAIRDYEEQQQIKQSQSQQQNIVEGWNAATDRGAEKYEDFDTVVGDLKPTSPWSIAIMQSENAADVAYHLGKNLKEAQRIISLNPIAQIYEIGRLSAKLLSAPPVVKRASKAPAPITPLSGGALADSNLEAVMPYENFLKVRNKQLGRT